MNQLELFKATVAHQSHDSFLFYASFTPEADKKIRNNLNINEDIDLRRYFNMYAPVDVNMKPSEKKERSDFSSYYTDIDIPSNAFINGLGVLEVPGSMYHFTQYISPLRNAHTLSEIEDFPYPNVDGYTDDHMKHDVEKAHQHNLVTCCHLTHMYEDAWQIRGYTEFLMDMITNPDICEYILDKIMTRNLKKAVAAATAGVDVIISGDDVANQRAMMFAPELWRKFIKTRWEKVYQAARSIKPDIQIWYHSDGNIMDIIPDLIDIGVTILNPVQPECIDIAKVKEMYGKHLVLDGTIGTQSTMPFASAEEVTKVVMSRKKELGQDGALIISPTHVLEPDVPIENVIAFIEAASGTKI